MYAHVELRVYRAVRLGSSLILALLLIASLQPSFAQLSTGTITGVVRDTTGAIVPNASAVLKNVETTVERRTVTNNAGNYSFTNVTPGRYTMQISGTGFRVNQVAEFVLTVNQTLTVDSVLEVGNLEQTVQVEASAERLQSSTAELGAVVDEKQVADLPLNGRQFVQLTLLSDNVYLTPVGTRGAALAQTGRQVVIAGQRSGHYLYTLDGVSITDQCFNNFLISPLVEALQEFKIEKSIYSA